MVAGTTPRYIAARPLRSASASALRMVAPGMDCTRVLTVSSGCSASVEQPEERPPASAALTSTSNVPARESTSPAGMRAGWRDARHAWWRQREGGRGHTAEGHARGALEPREVRLRLAAKLVAGNENSKAPEFAVRDGGVLGCAKRAQHCGGVVVRCGQAHALQRHCTAARSTSQCCHGRSWAPYTHQRGRTQEALAAQRSADGREQHL